MKKLLVILLANLLVIGIPAMARIYTEWEFNDGTLTIETVKTSEGDLQHGAVSSLDYLHIASSYSKGFQEVFEKPSGYYSWTAFGYTRYVEINNGEVETFTTRNNVGRNWYWPAYTEYTSYLSTSGSGTLYQTFFNPYSTAKFTTEISSDNDFLMGVWEYGKIGGEFEFALGGEGDNSGALYLQMNDRAEHNGWRKASGNFYFEGNSANTGFGISGTNILDFSAGWTVDGISGTVDMNTNGGEFDFDASGFNIILGGQIETIK